MKEGSREDYIDPMDSDTDGDDVGYEDDSANMLMVGNATRAATR